MDQSPTFNLKAVLNETGLKADTIRAWERRYGLPQPQRSAGRHRLYSRRDIETVKWLQMRQAEGLSISKAVDLWNSLEADGQDPLLSTDFATAQMAGAVELAPGKNTLADLRDAWITACKAFNERDAESILTQAFALYPVEMVCIQVLLAGLAQIGEGWYEGQITVEQEHFASELAMRRLEALLAVAPPPVRPGRVLIGAAPEEEHDFGLLLLTLLLRRQGWDTLYLGANVPLSSFESFRNDNRPQLVISSAQRLNTAATLLELALMMRASNIPFAYGGRIFTISPELRERIPGYFLGEQIELAPQRVEQIIAGALAEPGNGSAPPEYQEALEAYRESLPLIEADVRQKLIGSMSHEFLSIANLHVAQDIRAALTLGNLAFVDPEFLWIEGLLEHRNLPDELLPQFLNTYYQTLQNHLDDRGRPILEWLESIA